MNTKGSVIWPIIGVLVIALAASVFLFADHGRMGSSPSMTGSGPAMAVGKASTPQFMELFAEWCGPCRQMKPILDDLEKTYKGKVKFTRVDIDKHPDVARKFKVDAIPVQLFFDKNGKLVMKHVGFYSKADIVAQFKKMGVK